MRISIGLSLLLLSLLPEATLANAVPAPVPRYQLRPGQELYYGHLLKSRQKDGIVNVENEWQIWVVRQNKNGSWRIVVRFETFTWIDYDERGEACGARSEGMFERDLFSDGTIKPDHSVGFRSDLSSLSDLSQVFPRLPDDLRAARQGWESFSGPDGSRRRLKPAPVQPADPDSWVFTETFENPKKGASQTRTRRTFTFDRKQNLIECICVRIEENHSGKDKFEWKGEARLSLIQHDETWRKQFAAEVSRYSGAIRACRELRKTMRSDEEFRTRAVAILQAAIKKIHHDPFRKDLEWRLLLLPEVP